jgi:ribosomal protein S18 acetylase RimI-like enzyme
MEYRETILLKDGRTCVLRNGTFDDGQAMLDIYALTHAQTDYLLSYPDEVTMTALQEAQFLREKTDSENEIELLAEVEGRIVGAAGIAALGKKEKIRHRADFGIGIDRAYWGLGIGRALTRACIELARQAGYSQLELEAVADNAHALALYESEGFREYGRNPRGFRSRYTGWQELVYMRLELDR